MRRLLVTTASVIALGLGGIGLANAQGYGKMQSGPGGSSTTAATAQTPEQNQTMTPTRPHHMTMRTSRSEITQAQQRLREDHLYRGRVDGRFGPQTRLALRRFQQQSHLPVTARLDSRTMNSLMGGSAMIGQGSSRAPGSSHNRTMGQGSSQLQQNVNQPSGTMGQGSSATPGGTQLTPPAGNTNTGETNPNTPTNQK
jgi:peptidoglycan hydrolase-like protein with peptidoglycan-binding domain